MENTTTSSTCRCKCWKRWSEAWISDTTGDGMGLDVLSFDEVDESEHDKK